MSLHPNESKIRADQRCGNERYATVRRWLARGLCGTLLAALGASALPVRADEPKTAAEIEARIEELANKGELTDAELEEMVELGRLYADTLAAESGGASPTPAPAAPAPTVRPRPTPRPSVATRKRDTKATTESPAPSPTPRGRSSRPRPPAGRPTPTPAPTAATEELVDARDLDAEQFLLPYDQREYEFSIKDGSYAQLLETFGRMASLPVIGTAPAGNVNFVSGERMDFKTALSRVQMLLIKHPDKYWVLFKEDVKVLEIVRIADIYRVIPLNRIYTSVEDYRADNLDDNEIALLLYVPESGSVGELEPLRDFMPDYFLTAPLPGEKNAQTVFGLVEDINKYLALIKKFETPNDDPRLTKIIPIAHVKASAALETLKQLVDFGPTAGAPASTRRGGQASAVAVVEYGVTAIADDDRGSILVRAMPKKIEEIEKFLKFVDLPIEGGELYEPVVIRVQHTDAGKVMELVKSIISSGEGTPSTPAAATSAAAKRAAARRGKAAAAAPTAAAPLQSPELAMLHWAPANSIILIGSDEEVTEARALIERFDVPDDVDTQFVDLEFRTAQEACNLTTALLQASMSGEAPRVTCTPESGDASLILAGPAREVSQARAIIAKLDVDSGAPPDNINTIVLDCMAPSALVGILTAWDAADAPTAAPAQPAGSAQRRARRPAARAPSTGKFQPDDATRTLRVICTDEDWQERYEPMISRLDREACGEPEHTILKVEHIASAEAISTLTSFFGGGGKGGPQPPTMLPVATGVMVVGATPTDLATMKMVLAEIDIDPLEAGLVERRTFELTHVEPADILPVLQALTDSQPAAPAPRRGAKAPAPVPTSASAEVSFVEHGNRIWVSAPPPEMERIAGLIEELDVPESLRELRPYDFEVGTNVVELAETLRQLFPEAARVAATAQPARRPRRTPATAAAAGAAGDSILFIPQPAMRRIFVSAPVDMFPEIEQTIELVRPESGPQGKVVVKFYNMEKAEPQNVAEIIEPIVQLRINEMIAAGELPEPGKQVGSFLRMTPDGVSGRLVVAAPQAVIPEIEELIAQVEAGDLAATVVETVRLANSSAAEVAEIVGRMLGSSSPAPARRTPPAAGRGGRREAPAAPKPAGSSVSVEGVTIVPLPSDDTLIVKGPKPDVDEVLGWIEMLDSPDNRGRQMKVYHLAFADVQTVADTIMTVLDSGGAAKPKPELDEFGLPLDLGFGGGPQRGTDISLTTNVYSNSMVVWASPRKIAEIDEYVELFETGEMQDVAELPSEIVDLKYADAYDAKYALQDIIDTLWSGEKPKIDYVPFQNMLVVKSRNLEGDVPRVKDLIAKYIDTPDKAGASLKIERQAITGGPAGEIVAELLMRLGNDVDVEVEGLTSGADGRLLETLAPQPRERRDSRDITPCVLPAALTRALDSFSALAAGLTEEDGAPPAGADTSGLESALGDALRARLAEQSDARQDEPGAAGPTPGPDAPAETTPAAPTTQPTEPLASAGEAAPEAKPQVKISVDSYNNAVTISGAPRDVEAVKKVLEDILEEIEDAASGAPDIRVWRLEYVDPNVAAQVLENMFNASSPTSRAAEMAALQAARMAAARAAATQARGRQQQPGQPDQKDQGEQGRDDERSGRERPGGQEAEQPQVPKPQQGISVFPYPPLHAIIVKAPTEMYPAIERLVATIDRKSGSDSDFRFFKVHSQAASEVEAQLKVIFNIDQPQAAAGRRTAQAGRGRTPAGAAAANVEALMAQQFDLAGLGEEAATLGSTSSVTITSNDATNTVLVRGPEPVLDLAEEIIGKIEENAPEQIETKPFPLKFADAATLVPQLKELFALGPKDSYHPDNVQAVFLADTLNNAVIVRARASDFERIQQVISQLDVQTGPPDKAVTVMVTCGDAEKFAKLLASVYGLGRRGNVESAKKVEFVGDAASNTVVFTAPPELREEITRRIDELDQTACDLLEPRFITLASATPSMVAKVIEGAFGGTKRIRVAGDDVTRQLIVTCPAETFTQIEAFAKKLDTAPSDLEMKTYTLKYARASEVLQQMQAMFRDLAVQLRGKGVPVDAFAGSASDRANTITVAGGPITFAAVEKFLADIDVPAQDTAVGTMVVALQKTDATEVANMIRRLFPRPENGVEPPRAEANDRTNTLVVIGTQAQRDRIQNEVISKLEEFAPQQQDRETRVFTVTYADLNDVRNSIATAFRLERGANDTERVDVAVENATRSVVVTAKPDKLEKVAALIQQLDVDGGTATIVQNTYQMQRGKASQVADVINRSIRETRQSRQGPPISVVANDDLNIIVFSSTQKAFETWMPLVEKLDQAPAEGELVIKVYPVKFADPGSLIQTVNNSFPRLPGQRPEDVVRASYTWGTSSLVVAASEKNHERVARILSEVDIESSLARTTHVLQLKEANAEELAGRLTDIINKTQRPRRDDKGVAVVADPATNSLLVFASESEFATVQDLVTTLDVPPSFTPEIRSFKLLFAEAWPTREAIVELFGRSRSAGRRPSPADAVSAVVDWGSNSVVVSAAKTKMVEIEKFIAQIDQSGQGARQVHVVQLKNAEAAGVVRALQEMFVQRSVRGQETVSISNPQGTDALLIKANEKEYAEISKVVETLDVLPGDAERSARMFALKYTNADEMQSILEDYLSRPGAGGGRGRGAALLGDVRITTMPSSNTVVATGNAEQLDRVAELVAKIDVEIEGAGNAPRIIHLEKAIASDIEPTLTQIFIEGATRRGGGRPGSSAQITPVIVANDYANTLIVRASPTDFTLIENLARSLDLEETDVAGRFKIVQVASTFRVADLAATIEQTVQQAAFKPGDTGRRGGGSRGQGEFTVQPIESTNSLALAGDPKQIQVAMAMIEQIQALGPAGGKVTKIIPLGNRDPDEIKRVIEDMINDNTSQGSSGRGTRGRRR